ncbi:unnamed protein product [Rotaria sordida]|uniref:G-protein coupled receptors family 1 profile domain-containing protein n=1 Tax=Rotaria sordida TaxID=392033 RepID=A0A813X5V5_9BILA|nr:unnamed protein product [Rotaria sordida]CAF3544825.1 unnamed protein product [Rotaria sordida]
MLYGSIARLIHISFSLSNSIIDKGFKIHWTTNNVDFFSTCRQIKWRHLNSVYMAKHICIFLIIFWILITIPTLIYVKPIQFTSNKRLCNYSSIVCLFGCLTLKNIHQIRNRRISVLSSSGVLSRMARIYDLLVSMLFLQIIICIISSIPFITQFIYDSLIQTIHKDEYRLAQEYIFLQISHLIFYFNYISMFYVNYLSSSIFRQLSKQVLIHFFKKKKIYREI